MILVTGTKRSGTSMWMQILDAGGFPWLGERYLGVWEDSIKEANPQGFYESKLRQGVFYATNPDPRTGVFLTPKDTRHHAVKVFVPGLIRTDVAYLDRVIATMRPWREYVTSITRLYALEDAYHDTLQGDAKTRAKRAVRRGRPKLPPEVEWWFEHYELIRDIATRRYPVHLTTYHRMLAEPDAEIRKVFKWLGRGDADAAAAVVDRELRTQDQQELPDADTALEPEVIATMDELYETAHEERALTEDLVQRLNAHQQTMVERWGPQSRDRLREDDDSEAPA